MNHRTSSVRLPGFRLFLLGVLTITQPLVAQPTGVMIEGAEVMSPGLAVKTWTTPGVLRYANKPQQTARVKSKVFQIVIHETTGATWQGIPNPNLGVHFHLDRDGTIVQHADAVDMLWHAEACSAHSVGIENVNIAFDNDDKANPGETDPGVRIPIKWSGSTKGYYVVPPRAQLEALFDLVQVLKQELGVGDNWPQVMPHPDPANREAQPDRTFFLMMTGGHRYFPSSIVNEPVIIAHSVLGGHADGAFHALYLWLRLARGKDADAAYQLALQIAEDADQLRHTRHFDHKTNATLQLLDVSDLM
jgi:hypothetical protein